VCVCECANALSARTNATVFSCLHKSVRASVHVPV
jgi:hypothetical protein